MPGLGLAAGVTLVLTTLLGLAVYEVRSQDKELAVLEMQQALQTQAIEHAKVLNTAVVSAQTEAQTKETALVTQLNLAEAELLRRSRDAENQASDKPIGFGDEFIGDIIRLDCLWALGRTESDPTARAACVRETELASASSAIIPVTVITPEFRQVWVEACDDWTEIGRNEYELEDWTDEYGNFDDAMCQQTVVAFTPEFSYYFRNFLNNAEAYTARLTNFAEDNRRLLDVITTQRASTTTSNE